MTTAVRRTQTALLAMLLTAAALAACTGPRSYTPFKPPSTAKSSAPAPSRAMAAKGEIVVASGDTVYGIARRHGVPLRALIEVNGLGPPYLLKVGQILRLPVLRIHIVRKGETVYGISRRSGIDMAALVKLNRIPPPYTIKVGDRLALPSPTATAPPTDTETTVAAGPAPAPPAASPPAKPGRRATVPRPPPRAASRFLWPVRGRIVSRFGPKQGGLHNDGINILARRGTTVKAAENGVVAYAGNELKGFGKLLLIKHSDGWITAYAHNDRLLVRRGDTVRRGQAIARSGSTGNVDRPQLHFEIRRGKRAVDPLRHLDGATSTASADP